MPYIGKAPEQGVRNKYKFTASGGETSLSGNDANGKALIFSDGEYVDAYINGILLVHGSDYNTTTTNTIAGLSALSAGDVVEVIVYDTFSLFNGEVESDFNVNGTIKQNGNALPSAVVMAIALS